MSKSKIKLTVVSVIFLQIFLQMISAQVITLSASPSEYRINGKGTSCFIISFFNPHGDVDANYSLSPDNCLTNVFTSYQKSVIVPKGTTISNPINSQICLNGDFTEKRECYLYIKAKPVSENNESGNIQIERQIAVRFKFGEGDLIKPTTTTTTITSTMKTTTTVKSQSGSISNNTTTTKTSTTTKITKTTTILKTTTKQQVVVTNQQNIPTLESSTTTTIIETVEAGVNTSIIGIVLLPILIVAVVGITLFIKNKIDKKFEPKIVSMIFLLMLNSVIASSLININVDVILPTTSTTTPTTTPLVTTTTTTTTPIPISTTLGFVGRTLGEFGDATGSFLNVMKNPLTNFILILGLVSFALFLLYKIIEGIEFIFKI